MIPSMLILCSGEDSYRALEKARELEAAFKQKYDPSGSAVDRLPSGKEGVEALLVSATGGSLFASRRYFRVDNLLSSCPKGRLDALVKTLERDVENTIVVTVEEGEIAEKNLKPYASLQKFIHYRFSAQSPALFLKWAQDHAVKQGVSDVSAIKKIVENSLGDSWVFVNELAKWRAGAQVADGSKMTSEVTVYDVIDRLLSRRADRWSSVRAFDDADAIVAMAAGQARSLLLVQSGHTAGVHPYVAQKLSRLRDVNGADAYVRLAKMLEWSRTGRSAAEEALDVLG
jgi:hypothetical protein